MRHRLAVRAMLVVCLALAYQGQGGATYGTVSAAGSAPCAGLFQLGTTAPSFPAASPSVPSSSPTSFVPAPALSMVPIASVIPGSITNVTLGIYSGRPDPTWALTEAESAELCRLVSALPSTIGDPPQGGLGYHGFFLVPADTGKAERTLVAYRGTVADLGEGSGTYLVDVDRTVERYLLETGRSHLSAGEVEAVETDLATITSSPTSSGRSWLG